MNIGERKQLAIKKARQWANGFGSAVELMAGESVKAAVSESDPAASQTAGAALSLKCTFGFTEAPLWVLATEEAWSEIASAAVTGAGIEDADSSLRRQTWRELVSQAANLLIADRSNDSAVQINKEEVAVIPPEDLSQIFAVELTVGSKSFTRFYVSLATALVDAFSGPGQSEPAGVEPRVPATLDRLLDVELPLSVSFGRTNVPVQDILKLGSGSIIELNCPANDLVELIVNNCMIARGEVVVIEGNYGVRIREIISRRERMALHNVRGSEPMKLTA